MGEGGGAVMARQGIEAEVEVGIGAEGERKVTEEIEAIRARTGS